MTPSTWQELTWGDVVELSYGKALRDYRESHGPVTVFGTNGPVGFTGSAQAKGPGVVVGRKGAYRGVHYSPGDYWVIDTAFYLDPKKPIDMRWAYYALQLADINGLDSGSAIPSTTRESFAGLRALLPPLREQQAIAEVLGALDDKIAANTRLSTLSESMIRVGRPLIRIRDLKTFESQVWTTESRPKEIIIRGGDIVVGMDAEFRATAWLGEPGLLNQRVMKASHRQFGPAIVHELLRAPLSEIEKEKSATTVIHLNKADLARKSVSLPNSQDALRQFETVAEPLHSMRVSLANENRTLAATRDALLPQLMSGKLRVRDAERMASNAGA